MIDSIICSFLGIVAAYMWMYFFCGCRIREVKYKACFIIFCLIFVFLQSYFYSRVSVFFEIIFAPIMSLMLFQGKIKDLLLRWFFSYFYISVISDPIHMIIHILKFFDVPVSEGYKMESIVQVLSIGIMYLGWRVLNKTNFARETRWIFPNKYYYIAIALSVSASGITAYVSRVLNQENKKTYLVVYILVSVFIELIYICGIYLFYADIMRKRYKRLVVLKEEYIENLREYYNLLEEKMRETRKIRHEIKNNFNIIEKYLECGKEEDALRYINRINKTIMYMGKTYDVGSDLISAVITYIHRSIGTELICQGHIYIKHKEKEEDVCIVIANILKNAMENSVKGKPVYLEIKEFNQSIVIECKNWVEQDIKVEKLKCGYTQKTDVENHGFGIENVEEIIEKYHGMITFKCENKQFEVLVII